MPDAPHLLLLVLSLFAGSCLCQTPQGPQCPLNRFYNALSHLCDACPLECLQPIDTADNVIRKRCLADMWSKGYCLIAKLSTASVVSDEASPTPATTIAPGVSGRIGLFIFFGLLVACILAFVILYVIIHRRRQKRLRSAGGAVETMQDKEQHPLADKNGVPHHQMPSYSNGADDAGPSSGKKLSAPGGDHLSDDELSAEGATRQVDQLLPQGGIDGKLAT